LLHATEIGISSGRVGLLGSCATFPTYLSTGLGFGFLGARKLGLAQKQRKAFFARALLFCAPKSEKCSKPAENPTETLATLAGTDTEN